VRRPADVVYANRSFEIENHSPMPLHFTLSHNLRRSTLTEVNFSLSNSALKLFSTLLVSPHSSVRVYLHLRTSAAPEAAAAEPQHDNVLQGEISVSCHLVKDFHKVIRLQATCHQPHLRLSQSAIEWRFKEAHGLESGRPQAMKLEPASHAIEVSSLGRKQLPYAVRSSCCFFQVHASQVPSASSDASPGTPGFPGDCVLSASDTRKHVITVTPDDEAIRQHAAFLAKARYVEEHFTVYNSDDLGDHLVVLVRLSCGHAHHQAFSYAHSKPSHSSNILEEDVLRFSSSFKAFWEAHVAAALSSTEPLPSGADEGPETAPGRARAALHAKWDEVVSDRTYRQLWFDFRHITDELVFYGMKAQTSHFVSPLANLFYKMLFTHEAFAMFLSASQRGHRRMASAAGSEPKARRGPAPQRSGMHAPRALTSLPRLLQVAANMPTQLVRWVKQLSYFLMHFPDATHSGIEPLRKLERAFSRADQQQQEQQPPPPPQQQQQPQPQPPPQPPQQQGSDAPSLLARSDVSRRQAEGRDGNQRSRGEWRPGRER
jgi:hypothetical protein